MARGLKLFGSFTLVGVLSNRIFLRQLGGERNMENGLRMIKGNSGVLSLFLRGFLQRFD